MLHNIFFSGSASHIGEIMAHH